MSAVNREESFEKYGDVIVELSVYMKEKIYDAIEAVTGYNLRHKVKLAKPTHGTCCTCQRCGYHHDDRICEHNKMVDILNKWFEKEGINDQ